MRVFSSSVMLLFVVSGTLFAVDAPLVVGSPDPNPGGAQALRVKGGILASTSGAEAISSIASVVLPATALQQQYHLRLQSSTNNSDQLRAFINRKAAGSGWDTAEWYLGRYVDITNLHQIVWGHEGGGSSLRIGRGYPATNDLSVFGNGHVGIGSTSAPATLQIQDGEYAAIGLGPDGPNAWYIAKETAGAFNIWQGSFGASANRLTITSAGNVGIGEQNPTSKLTVNGTISAINNQFDLKTQAISLASGGYFMRVGGEPGNHIAFDAHSIQAKNSASQTNTLNMQPLGGQVVMGGSLEVGGPIRAIGNQFDLQMQAISLASGGYFMRVGGELGNHIAFDYNSIQAKNTASQTNALNIQSLGGPVIIGKDPAAQNLQVKGGILASTSGANAISSIASVPLPSTPNQQQYHLTLMSSTGNGDQLRAFVNRKATGSDWGTAEWYLGRYVDVTNLHQIVWGNDGVQSSLRIGRGYPATNDFSVFSNGHIGIGSTSAQATLQIQDGQYGSIGLGPDGPSAWYITKEVAGSFNIWQGTFGSSVNRFSITSSGNVGIGVQNPTSKLAVNGTISASEVKVTANPADYVFADDYKLRPLSEVEQHVREKRHLPGIPSAKEQLDAGNIAVADMQRRHLEKIEELTLYAIEADKKIAALERQVANQDQQMAEIKRLIQKLSAP